MQYGELVVLKSGRGARKIKDTKEICSPISLLENGASAQEALSTAEAFGDDDG